MLLRGLFNQSKEIEFFRFSNLLSYISLGAITVSIILFFILGLNYGIDFREGYYVYGIKLRKNKGL